MKHKYIAGVAVPAYDDKVSAAMEGASFDGGGNVLTIAIENEQGQVYRVFKTEGLREYMEALDSLFELGLIDLMGPHSAMSPEGYDNRFRAAKAR
ncbi:hypothetical protein QU487_02510 [Crenobacter sp. SG2305]|uniref:hypothetical protein n=1 Tax=Crenobacter oryzisoli TaxID=3056844 RepID=UPI0025AB08AE|nr:hypothetical protein [Crenobacter sp. SG2305]MDN0081633.1 hypothetical protein [Crenobacter sp. SG2305]